MVCEKIFSKKIEIWKIIYTIDTAAEQIKNLLKLVSIRSRKNIWLTSPHKKRKEQRPAASATIQHLLNDVRQNEQPKKTVQLHSKWRTFPSISGRGLPSPKHRSSYVQGEHTQQGRLTENDTLAGSNSTQKKKRRNETMLNVVAGV